MTIPIEIIEMQIEDIKEEIKDGHDVDKNKLYRALAGGDR